MCQKCRDNESKVAMGMSATKAPAPGEPTSTVDGEKARFRRFSEDAVVTNLPTIFLGAPTYSGSQYGIGYRDNNGVNRAFIIPADVAHDMAQGILQELASEKNALAKAKLRKVLEENLRHLNVEGVSAGEVISDLNEELEEIA